jgi:beta-lactam-binding protein with PASTA domain
MARFLNWLRSLARNPYFWGGLGALFVLAAVVYVTFNSFVMPSYTRHDVSIRVPGVEGQPFEQAKQTMRQLDLQVQRQAGRYNPNVERGVVVDQNPPQQSTVKPGRRVYLTVNTGELPSVRLPDLTGTSLREARNRVQSLGLTVGPVQPDPIPSPYPNTVTRQRPEPGDSLDRGEKVRLWYSTGLGDEQVAVPALQGLPVEAAQQQLLERNLRSVVVEAGRTSGDAASPEGEERRLFVREQGSAAGSRVRAGTEIRLFTTEDPDRAQRLRSAVPDSLRDAPRAPADSTAPVDSL